MLVKICGLTETDHALAALEAGADMLGFVFAPSRRRLAPDVAAGIIDRCRALFPSAGRPWSAVGVFANQPLGFVREMAGIAGLDFIQLSGEESPDYCRRLSLPLIKTLHLSGESAVETSLESLESFRQRCGAFRLLLDSGGTGRWGGTGETFRWDLVGDGARESLVAGGLTPDNVAGAIATLRPWGVDVSSGVESGGRKTPALIARFISEVRRIETDANRSI